MANAGTSPGLFPTGRLPALRIFRLLLKGFEAPAAFRLWDGTVHAIDERTPAFTLVVRDPALLRRLVVERSPLLLADACFRGALDIEGDLYSALRLKQHFASIALSWRDKMALLRDALRLPKTFGSSAAAASAAGGFFHRHSRNSDRAAISFHYDVSNAFYGLWLDDERVYSCAYFERAEDTLEAAQRNKLEHVSAANCVCSRGSACSTSAAAGAPWSAGPHATMVSTRTASP